MSKEQGGIFADIRRWSENAEAEHQFNQLIGRYSDRVWGAFVELEKRHQLILDLYMNRQGRELFAKILQDVIGREVDNKLIIDLENGMGAYLETYEEDPLLSDQDRADIATYQKLIIDTLIRDFKLDEAEEDSLRNCLWEYNQIAIRHMLGWLNAD